MENLIIYCFVNNEKKHENYKNGKKNIVYKKV